MEKTKIEELRREVARDYHYFIEKLKELTEAEVEYAKRKLENLE